MNPLKLLKQSLLSLLLISSASAETVWPFFPFDNGVGRGVWTAEVQADTVRKLGYDGIHYNYTNPEDFAVKMKACKAAGVPIHAVYLYTFVNKPGQPYDPRFKEVIRMLKGSSTMIWMTLRDGSRGKQDAEAASIVREVAELASESNLQVSIYPHAGFYVATAEDALRVANVANRPNVGVSINLCHELFAGNAPRLGEIIQLTKGRLNLVSINGASPIPGKGPKAWVTLPLGAGDFDTVDFLKKLHDSGYRGPIGHQFFGVAGDDREKLERAIQSWRLAKSSILSTAP